MKIARTKNAIRNSVYGFFANLLGMLFPFVIRTVFIKTIGIDYLGLNGLFSSILNILNLTELGIGSAIVFSMYKPIAEDDHVTICALINLYKKMYRVIGTIVLCIGLGILPFLDYFIKGDVPADINIYLLFMIYLTNAVLTYWLFAYKTCLLTAHQRTDAISKVQMFCHLLMYLGQILALVYVKNYYVYIICLPLSTILINLGNCYFANKQFPEYSPCGQISEQLTSDINKRVAGLMLDKVAMASRNAFDSIVVSMFIGLTEVAIYNNYYYIITAVGGFLTVFLNGIAAGIGNSIAADNKKKNEYDMMNINFLFMSIVGLGFCCFLNLYQPFMRLWVGDACLFPELTMIAFSVFFLIQRSESIIGRYYDAAGLWWIGKLKGVIEATVNVLLNILLCQWFGALGVISATSISVLLVALPLEAYYLYKYYYHTSVIPFMKEQITNILIFMLIGFVSHAVINFVDALLEFSPIIIMLVNLLLTLLMYVGIYLLVIGRTRRYSEAIHWLKSHKNIAILDRKP